MWGWGLLATESVDILMIWGRERKRKARSGSSGAACAPTITYGLSRHYRRWLGLKPSFWWDIFWPMGPQLKKSVDDITHSGGRGAVWMRRRPTSIYVSQHREKLHIRSSKEMTHGTLRREAVFGHLVSLNSLRAEILSSLIPIISAAPKAVHGTKRTHDQELAHRTTERQHKEKGRLATSNSPSLKWMLVLFTTRHQSFSSRLREETKGEVGRERLNPFPHLNGSSLQPSLLCKGELLIESKVAVLAALYFFNGRKC